MGREFPPGLLQTSSSTFAKFSALSRNQQLAHNPTTKLSSRPNRISCHAAQDRATCAPFSKERRMKFARAAKLNRKSGKRTRKSGWAKWRDLRLPQPAANSTQGRSRSCSLQQPTRLSDGHRRRRPRNRRRMNRSFRRRGNHPSFHRQNCRGSRRLSLHYQRRRAHCSRH